MFKLVYRENDATKDNSTENDTIFLTRKNFLCRKSTPHLIPAVTEAKNKIKKISNKKILNKKNINIKMDIKKN